VRHPSSSVIVHGPAASRLGAEGGGTYVGAASWWQRQRPASRIGVIAAAVGILLVTGWLAASSLVRGDPPAGVGGADAGDAPTGTTDASRSAPVALPPEPRLVTIHSEPPGATVRLEGEELPGKTPVNVSLLPGQTYDLELQLAGHHPARRDDLDPATLERQVVSFDLEPVPPPGQLAVRAAYPVELKVDGRAVRGTPSLEEGSYQIEISAPSVLYRETRRVQVRAGQTTTIDLPRTTQVRVIAIPANAEVSVDGNARAFEPPFDLEVVEGTEHSFRFVWPDGRVQQQRIVVGSSVRQILGSPSEVETRG
jgi:hypothetical protein